MVFRAQEWMDRSSLSRVSRCDYVARQSDIPRRTSNGCAQIIDRYQTVHGLVSLAYSKSFHAVENKIKTSNLFEIVQHRRCPVKSWIFRLWAVCTWAAIDAKLQMAFHQLQMQQFSLKCIVSERFMYRHSGHWHCDLRCARFRFWVELFFLSFLLVPFSCALDSSTESAFIHSWRIVGDARVRGKIVYFYFSNETCRSAAVALFGNRRQTNRCAELIENGTRYPMMREIPLSCDYWMLLLFPLSRLNLRWPKKKRKYSKHFICMKVSQSKYWLICDCILLP